MENAKEFVIGAFLLGCLAILLALLTADRNEKPDQQTCPQICEKYDMVREWSYTSADMFACVCKKVE